MSGNQGDLSECLRCAPTLLDCFASRPRVPTPQSVHIGFPDQRLRFAAFYVVLDHVCPLVSSWATLAKRRNQTQNIYYSDTSKSHNSQTDMRSQNHKDLKTKGLPRFGKNLPYPSFSVFLGRGGFRQGSTRLMLRLSLLYAVYRMGISY